MNILVTGGAGYIGSITVKKLLEAGHRVTVLDSLENGHHPAVDRRAVFVKVDLREKSTTQKVIGEGYFDAAIHFAGYIESGESMENPLKFFENNFSGGLNLLMAMKKAGLKKIVFSSTASVYGNGEGTVPPFVETSPVNPNSYYGLSKYFFERALKAVSLSDGFQVVVLRYFNAAGALADGGLGEAHQPETHLLPLAVKTALGQSTEFRLYGTDYPTPDKTAVRDYVHVEDLAEAHLLSLKKLESGARGGLFEIYNVGSGKGFSNREIIEMVKKVSGRDFKVIESPRRAGDWAISFANSEKIRNDLGWQARRGLKEIVESAYLWHQAHPYGFS